MTSNSVVPSKACPKLNPSPEISGGMTSAGRNAKKPHVCLRSSTRPSAKQGDSSDMKSRINKRPIHSQFWQKPTDVPRVIASLCHCFRVVTAQLPIYAATANCPYSSYLVLLCTTLKGSDTAVSKRRVQSTTPTSGGPSTFDIMNDNVLYHSLYRDRKSRQADK